ncbi:serine protease snake-like [Teleopsis dalmanni]|uniref:serine protease snake-like n=1 Tax=Teleopsis dalmanni TaxID=139649 RepID=UPI0018CD5A4E|nr:serine protease snake-like [Teleopsis dalmanni]
MDNQDIDYKCGGSLISENFIVTAAHCTNITGQSPIQVRIGDLNLKADENNVEPQTLRIRNIYIHPSYRSTSYYNDIALLELEEDVEFTEFVRPIHLWVNESIPYTIAFAMGYGATAFGKERTNRLTDLNMTIISNDECNRVMPALPETASGIISSQICAQDKLMNRDTCQGDSGGPLQLNVQGRRRRKRKHFYLIGITSYGLACRSGNPSVHTRISSYLDWIESIVWRNE